MSYTRVNLFHEGWQRRMSSFGRRFSCLSSKEFGHLWVIGVTGSEGTDLGLATTWHPAFSFVHLHQDRFLSFAAAKEYGLVLYPNFNAENMNPSTSRELPMLIRGYEDFFSVKGPIFFDVTRSYQSIAALFVCFSQQMIHSEQFSPYLCHNEVCGQTSWSLVLCGRSNLPPGTSS